MKALQHLCRLAGLRKAERHHYVPASCIPRSKYSDQDSKGLTQCIVDWFVINNHFVTSISSTLNCRIDSQRFSSSVQRIELPRLFAVVEGRAVFVEVNQGKEQLSYIQLRTIYDWFNTEFILLSSNYDTTK